MSVSSSSKEKLEDYEAFVEKFKPKLTTDDCFTPPRCMTPCLSGCETSMIYVTRQSFDHSAQAETTRARNIQRVALL